MTHDQSLQTHAPERYLLGEMSELEKHHFEEHYFSCDECADSVRIGAMLAANTCAVFAQEPARETRPSRSWLDWFRVPFWAPSLVAVALCCVVAYQALVQVPSLKQAYTAQSIDPVALRSTSRGAELSVPVSSRPGFFSVAAFPPADAQAGSISYTLEDAGGRQVTSGNAVSPAPGRPLTLLFPNNAVRPDSRYVLRLSQPGRDLGEFPFVVARR